MFLNTHNDGRLIYYNVYFSCFLWCCLFVIVKYRVLLFSGLPFGIILYNTVCVSAKPPVNTSPFAIYPLWSSNLCTFHDMITNMRSQGVYQFSVKSQSPCHAHGASTRRQKALFQSTMTFSPSQTLPHLTSINPSTSQWTLTIRKTLNSAQRFHMTRPETISETSRPDSIKQ